MFCIPKHLTNLFLEKLKSGEINPEKLSSMSSQERRDYFATFLGEANAQQVNALFESKLLLKNQQKGIINWAKQVSGMKPEVMRDILSRVNKMTEVLKPADEKSFLEDLAAHKLGTTVTMEEAGNISSLAKAVSDAKTAMGTGGDRMDYGRAKVAFANYVNGLKESAAKKTLGEKFKDPIGALSYAAGTAKSLKASFDNSAIFRQGWKTLWTNPGIWLKNAGQTFIDAARTVGGKNVMDEINADIVSRPNYDLMVKAKLATGTIEEAYPTSIAAKVPLFGRLYKASETAFTGFIHRVRADVFDKYIEVARRTGVDLEDKDQLESIGKLVNSLTGRGHLGKAEPAADLVNNVFFSPRLLKSHVDVLLLHATDKGFSAFARKQAAINLVKIISGTAAVLTVANAVNPNSVEKDPRSSDFGQIKVGNTRFNVSGGMASVITLASRLITMSTKSTTTKTVTPLNAASFGSKTGADVVYNFFENKLSPAASIIKDLLKGQDFQGNKPTLLGEASNLLMPLGITNYLELKNDPNSADLLVSMIADGLGIATNTYSGDTNWSKTEGVQLIQFRQKIGDEKFKQANKKFNDQFDAWFAAAQKNPKYDVLSDGDKQKALISEKKKIKQEIFNEYRFRYQKPVKKKVAI